MPTKRSQPEIGCPIGRFWPIFAGNRSGIEISGQPESGIEAVMIAG
jgi:hypothetical protein